MRSFLEKKAKMSFISPLHPSVLVGILECPYYKKCLDSGASVKDSSMDY